MTMSTAVHAPKQHAPLAVYVLNTLFSLQLIMFAVNVTANNQGTAHKDATLVNVATCLMETWHSAHPVVVRMVSVLIVMVSQSVVRTVPVESLILFQV